MSVKKVLNIALLGYGYLGKWHAQKINLHENVKFVGIVEPNIAIHAEIKKLYPEIKVVLDLAEIIDEIDAAIVVTPTSLHYQQVKYLIEQNKHVFCEKPLTHSFATAKELYQLANKYPNLIMQVGHSERCHQIFETKKFFLKELLHDGQCLIERYGSFKGRATDVSCVEDIMVHDLDLMMFLFEPQLLTCTAYGVKSKTQNWDTVNAIFKSKNQTFNFFVSRDAIEERRQLACYGSKGSAVVDFMNNKFTTTGNSLEVSTYDKRDHLLFEQQAFINSIKKGLPPMVTFENGMLACYLVEVVLQALKEQKTIDVKFA